MQQRWKWNGIELCVANAKREKKIFSKLEKNIFCRLRCTIFFLHTSFHLNNQNPIESRFLSSVLCGTLSFRFSSKTLQSGRNTAKHPNRTHKKWKKKTLCVLFWWVVFLRVVELCRKFDWVSLWCGKKVSH